MFVKLGVSCLVSYFVVGMSCVGGRGGRGLLYVTTTVQFLITRRDGKFTVSRRDGTVIINFEREIFRQWDGTVKFRCHDGTGRYFPTEARFYRRDGTVNLWCHDGTGR